MEILVFEEWGKQEYPEKNLSEKTREPTTNSTHIIMALTLGFEPGPQWWKASALTTAPSLLPTDTKQMADFVTTNSLCVLS